MVRTTIERAQEDELATGQALKALALQSAEQPSRNPVSEAPGSQGKRE